MRRSVLRSLRYCTRKVSFANPSIGRLSSFMYGRKTLVRYRILVLLSFAKSVEYLWSAHFGYRFAFLFPGAVCGEVEAQCKLCLQVDTFARARRLIDGRDNLDVASPKLSRHQDLALVDNAVGEVIHHRGLLIDGREVQRSPAGFAYDAAIGEGMLFEVHPAFLALDAEVIGAVIETGD